MKELNNFRKFIQENELHEGTWSLGSVAEMVKVLGKLEQIRKMGASKGGVELENIDNALYNVFGDDSFSDAIDAAKGTDDDDRFNNFIGDAQARAMELYKSQEEYEKDRFEEGEELEENDAVLDEIIGEEKKEVTEASVFDRIDQMMDTIADQMSPDHAFQALAAEFQVMSGGTMMLERALRRMVEDLGLTGDVRKEEITEGTIFDDIDDMLSRTAIHMKADDFVDELVQEFEAISGGPKKLHQALKNIVLNNNIPEADFERDSAIIKKRMEIRSAYNESLDEGLTQDILKKHPKKYKDEKAVKAAAAKLMKSPKFRGKGIGPVLQALLKDKE